MTDINGSRTATILMVDDDPLVCRQFELIIDKFGYSCDFANCLATGLKKAMLHEYDVVFLDVNLPDSSGSNSLHEFPESKGIPGVIIITGEDTPDAAELAVGNGAWYFLQKPLNANTIRLILQRVLQFREHTVKNPDLILLKREGLVGNDSKFLSCLMQVAQAATRNGNILIRGETGTGKKLIAKALHSNSRQHAAPFVVADCANIPDSLTDSILFGHERGAFTEATDKNGGLISLADTGVLFFDEVGDLPPSTQSSLLRVFQEKRYRPLSARIGLGHGVSASAAALRSGQHGKGCHRPVSPQASYGGCLGGRSHRRCRKRTHRSRYRCGAGQAPNPVRHTITLLRYVSPGGLGTSGYPDRPLHHGKRQESFREVLSIFMEQHPLFLQALRTSLETGALEEGRQAAHTLKNQLRTIGTSSCGDTIETMERTLKTLDTSPATGAQGCFDHEYAKLLPLLKSA